ncbi:TPA: VanZ family protein [Streptococcus agalactiae]|uniref:VanZ family protein n=1 Tax=Bacillota TaxID=1239 RepID=UPI0006910020|nr:MULTISPECIES: VanZ family protein [Bacillota]RLK63008.1 VanZ family protein [Atopobacter sp. AH10]VSI21158.1 teicoplanin resistance protein [Streptococcus pneumoniae]HEO3244238.1 VanZ family protein [Streptococcus agalactiae]
MKKKNILKILLFIYLILLSWLVLFKLGFSISDMRRVRDVNFIPFYYDNIIEGDLFWLEPIFNILIFIPFGILLKKISCGIKINQAFLIFLVVSLFFEIMQYIMSIGASDITDVITNVLGGVIGFLVADIFTKRKNN